MFQLNLSQHNLRAIGISMDDSVPGYEILVTFIENTDRDLKKVKHPANSTWYMTPLSCLLVLERTCGRILCLYFCNPCPFPYERIILTHILW